MRYPEKMTQKKSKREQGKSKKEENKKKKRKRPGAGMAGWNKEEEKKGKNYVGIL